MDINEFCRAVGGVNKQTVRKWVARGIVVPSRDSVGRYVFSLDDVAKVRPRCELIARRPRGLSVQDVLDVLPTPERGLVEAALETYAPVLTTAIREALS